MARTGQVTTKHSLKCLTIGPKWRITVLLGRHGRHSNSFATGAITEAPGNIAHGLGIRMGKNLFAALLHLIATTGANQCNLKVIYI